MTEGRGGWGTRRLNPDEFYEGVGSGGQNHASPVNTLVKKQGRSGRFEIWDQTFLTGKRLEVTIGLL